MKLALATMRTFRVSACGWIMGCSARSLQSSQMHAIVLQGRCSQGARRTMSRVGRGSRIKRQKTL